MKIARYQLVKHSLEEIQFRSSANGSMDEARMITTTSKKFQRVKEPESWLLAYQVKFGSPADPQKAAYTGLIRISADFVMDPKLSQAQAIAILDTEGSRTAYGIIRECLANLTARSLHGVLLLPDVDFANPANSAEVKPTKR